MVNASADPHSESVCQEHGVDVSTHRARQITTAMLQEYDLVLALDAGHVSWLNSRYPQFRGKVHKLGKWRKDEDVPDPYRHPLAAFEHCFEQVEAMVEDWLPKLK